MVLAKRYSENVQRHDGSRHRQEQQPVSVAVAERIAVSECVPDTDGISNGNPDRTACNGNADTDCTAHGNPDGGSDTTADGGTRNADTASDRSTRNAGSRCSRRLIGT